MPKSRNSVSNSRPEPARSFGGADVILRNPRYRNRISNTTRAPKFSNGAEAPQRNTAGAGLRLAPVVDDELYAGFLTARKSSVLPVTSGLFERHGCGGDETIRQLKLCGLLRGFRADQAVS
jgi:hypothetical protein